MSRLWFKDLPEQLIARAEFLLRNTTPNEAGARRAVSAAYYGLFHLLIRDAVENWKHADHRSRLARSFEHKRMKDASTAVLKEISSVQSTGSDPAQVVRFKLSIVAQAFVDLQQARHWADYVAAARLAFQRWAEIRDEPVAQAYLYSLYSKTGHDWYPDAERMECAAAVVSPARAQPGLLVGRREGFAALDRGCLAAGERRANAPF